MAHGHERQHQRWWMHVMRCFDISRWRTQGRVPVLVIPPTRLPVEPSTVLLPVPAAASVEVGGAAIGIGVASAVRAAGLRPPAPSSSVEPFAASAVGVRHETATLVVVASHTGIAADPVVRRVHRRLLRFCGSSWDDGAIAVTASGSAADLIIAGCSLLI